MKNTTLLLAISALTLPLAIGSSPFDGLTPKPLEAGSAAGSYVLSGLDTVNLYNRSVSLNVPLREIGGRGEAGFTLTAPINYGWELIKTVEYPVGCPDGCIFQYSNLRYYNYDYRPAIARLRFAGVNPHPTTNCGVPIAYDTTLTRLSVRFRDGSEMEFIDAKYSGAMLPVYDGSTPQPCGVGNRERKFVATDGSGATFWTESETQEPWPSWEPEGLVNGTLYFRDGRQYHFGPRANGSYDPNAAPDLSQFSTMDWIKDRNGNMVTFKKIQASAGIYAKPSGCLDTASGLQIVDPLGRLTEVVQGCTEGSEKVDFIRYKGANGDLRTTKVYFKSYTSLLGSDLSGAPYTMPLASGIASAYALLGWDMYNVPLSTQSVSRIQFPDGKEYSFLYTQFGEPSQVTLPTGAKIRYFWENAASTLVVEDPYDPDFVKRSAVLRRLTERWEYTNGVNASNKTVYATSATTIANPWPGVTCGSGSSPNILCTKVREQKFDLAFGSPSQAQDHYYYGSPTNLYSIFVLPYTYQDPKEGREFQTDTLDESGTPLRRKIDRWESGTGGLRIKTTDEINLESGNKTRRETTYSNDGANNPVLVTESDFFTGSAPTSLLRQTYKEYVTSGAYTDAPVHLRSLPTLVVVANGGGGWFSGTGTAYDEWPTASITGLVNYDPATAGTRGNPTTISRWRNTDGAWPSWGAAYDDAGNLHLVRDPKNYLTSYTYDNCASQGLPGAYALVSDITNPKSQTTHYAYDCNIGKPTSIANVAGHTTAAQYNDPFLLDRISQITTPNGGRTRYTYDANLHYVITEQDKDGADFQLHNSTSIDGFGRAIQSATGGAGLTPLVKDIQNDGFGRPFKVSNPLISGSGPNEWNTTTYDSLGRVIQTLHPDGSAETIQYWGERTLFSDALGFHKLQITDALGRVVRVVENPTQPIDQPFSCTTNPTVGWDLCTDYTYDPLGNLTSVTQGPQSRQFVYDSLGNLIAARNPEVDASVWCAGSYWSTCYAYDDNNNLVTQSSPGVTVTMAYDEINRVTDKTYSGESYLLPYYAGTPSVHYDYDTVQPGCLSSVTVSGISTTNFTSYNPGCQVTTSQQVSFGLTYNLAYSYNLAGALTREVYPSGRDVRWEYDGYGRPSKVCNTACGNNDPYASTFGYAQYGLQTSMTLGNGVPETRSYNNHLQPVTIQAGSSGSLFNLSNNYNWPGNGANNGDIWSQQTNDVIYWYNYDVMSRLANLTLQAQASGGYAILGGEDYAYDRFGNRAVTRTGSLPGLTGETPTTLGQYNTSTNRIGGSFTYDGRGNITVAPGRSMWYDGNNQQWAEQRWGGPTVYYWYDAAGKRVGKNDTTTATIFVYDALGRLAEEFSGPATGFANQNVTSHIYGGAGGHLATETTGVGRQYFTNDHLGSTRLVTNTSGTTVSKHDYLPFGEEIGVGCGTVASGVKFTSQYRDQESCLDNFVSRYMSPAQGRFTSVDPSRVSVNPGNPQTWNRYTYTNNNPLSNVDRNGLWSTSVHHELLSALYSGSLSERQIALLQKVSDDQDSPMNQFDTRAYKHGQCLPNDGQCGALISNHINSNLGKARSAAEGAEGLSDEALVYLGTAQHTISDSHSRWHTNADGPTTWSVFPRWWPSDIYHAVREAYDDDYWWGLGQSLRDMAQRDISALGPYSALRNGVNAAITNAVDTLVYRYFVTSGVNWGRNGEIDAARQCALGNPAACTER